MAKKPIDRPTSNPSPGLFQAAPARRHPTLFIPKLLAEEADRTMLAGPERDRAQRILVDWADMAERGQLRHKETALDADFLQKIFGEALGYRSVTDNPADYHRERNFTIPGMGTADAALGQFPAAQGAAPTAVIELKGADTDLDHDKFNGRTPVQQCWDYLNQLPGTTWGIVSNYVSIRLYHRDRPARAYDEFTVKDFRDPARFNQFYYLFERHGLIGNKIQKPRATVLLNLSDRRQREVGEKLYDYYAEQRLRLIETLQIEKHFSRDDAIHAAQRLLDRIIFMAFCQDRGLLPSKLIEHTWKNVPPLARATNPRWRNFLDAFHAIDKGHPDLELPAGYNGGLFAHDPLVDELDLEDQWAEVFKQIGDYDFREEGEINVDVLGHIFEQSVTELEKLRVAGLFGPERRDPAGAMPKSAERKRSGIYYTPPQFTRLIVDNTLGVLIRDRVLSLPDAVAQAEAIRHLKICDPACGSGAFLIAAYEKLEETYEDIARQLRVAGKAEEADALQKSYPDRILIDNLFGVDLSAESVEIAQLALWIRSARKGRTLADLSKNIVCGNSLVADTAVHPRAFVWNYTFPAIFNGREGGFDAVIGNPPWERMKLQEREFFSLAAPEIAAAVNAADRRKMIAKMEKDDPALWKRYHEAGAAAEKMLGHVRTCGEFPLTARGDVNTYMLFAELARKILARTGRAGLLVPSGIVTDDTTRHFFNDLMDKKSLIGVYDFENREGHFADVDRRFKFCVLLMGGSKVETELADFVFFAHNVEDLAIRSRHIELTQKDLRLLNPNTKTCPIFRSRADAELTKRIYRRVPVLVDQNRRKGGNPWGVKFTRMFDQTNDAELFKSGKELKDDGFKLDGNRWTKRKEIYLPLYEAKMIQAFDHRAAGVVVQAGNWMRQGQTEETSLVEHQNPEFVTLPRFWISEEQVAKFIADSPALLAYKDVTSPTNQRTMIAALVPRMGLMNSAPFVQFGAGVSLRRQSCLLANLNSLPYDFVARQKVGGLHLNFFIVEQIPTFPPDRYDELCPWDAKTKLEDWISDRALQLTCTAEDTIPLANAAGFKPPIHKWKDDEREQLRAELDAAFFILYGISRSEIETVLSSFQAIAKEDQSNGGAGPTRQSILAAFDLLST